MDKKSIFSAGTSTSTAEPKPLTYDIFQEAMRMVEGFPPPPKYYYSEHLQPDDIYQMDPNLLSFSFFPFDRKSNMVYICGENARDALIEEGVVFENYKPEEEK